MADKISDLEQKYAGFASPMVMVKVDGNEMKDESLGFTEVNASVTTGHEASVCTLVARADGCKFEKSLTGGVELKIDEVLEKFQLGKKIEVSLGYAEKSKLKPVFVGFINSIEIEVAEGEDVSYHIEAMDAKKLMMENLRSEVKQDVKKHSDAVTAILKDYSKHYDKTDVDATPEVGTQLKQFNQSDYDFIVEAAERNSCLFYVSNGVVRFKKYTTDKEVTVEVSPDAIRHLKREITLSEQVKKVTVIGSDPSDPKKPIKATVTSVDTVGGGSTAGSAASSVITDKMEKVIIDNTVASEAEAKTRAEAELMKASMNHVSGTITLVGMPEIEAGKCITLKGMGKNLDMNYLVLGVQHVLTEEGYDTICEVGANKT